jgi:hypothetical protein
MPSRASPGAAAAAGPSRLDSAPDPRPDAVVVAAVVPVLPVAEQVPEHGFTSFAISNALLVVSADPVVALRV